METDIVILGGARTAMAEYTGAFKDVGANDLGAHAARAAMARAGVEPEWIDHVVMGNALQTAADAIYGARHVGLKAGIPQATPALTVNRLCGSGIQSVISAAHLIRAGEAQTVLAGGMENMTQAPFVVRGVRNGIRLGSTQFEDLLMAALMDTHCKLYMAQTAEKLGRQYGISREEQDAYALRSHRLGAAAVKNGVFKQEIVPVPVRQKGKEILWDADDHIKPETSLEALAKLPPAFGRDGTVTAGNASGIVDGAAALVVAAAGKARERKLQPRARIVSWATVGVDPSIMGIGPVGAIRAACARGGVALEKVDLFEINEAFSAQYLAVEKELGLDRDRVNVNGGAIALGHPLGATGTRLLLTLLFELERRKGRYGIASACIGGGQGIAMLIERTA